MIYPLAEFLLSHLEICPEVMRPHVHSSPGRMCVAVDFGTVLSGVACGLSSGTVEQILWPEPNRKVPPSLIYDAQERIVTSGHRSQGVGYYNGPLIMQ
jgi:hypothetical protein